MTYKKSACPSKFQTPVIQPVANPSLNDTFRLTLAVKLRAVSCNGKLVAKYVDSAFIATDVFPQRSGQSSPSHTPSNPEAGEAPPVGYPWLLIRIYPPSPPRTRLALMTGDPFNIKYRKIMYIPLCEHTWGITVESLRHTAWRHAARSRDRCPSLPYNTLLLNDLIIKSSGVEKITLLTIGLSSGVCVISGLSRGVNEIFVLLGCYAA
jgi:hypothetical protein